MEKEGVAERPNEKVLFRQGNRRLQRDLEDVATTALPDAFTPEWPDFSPEAVYAVIDRQATEIADLQKKGEISGKKAEVLLSQVRAIDYLYGRRESAVDRYSSDNPLVDILTLITAPSDFQLATEGRPKPKRILGKVDKTLKPEQYTYEQLPSGRREFRSIKNFGSQLSTVIRGLYVWGEAAKHHPVLVRSSLTQYKEKLKDYQVSEAATAIGILEILNNANLIYDPRFNTLANQLRDVVVEDSGSYSEIKRRYSYSVLRKLPFWYNGEVEALKRKNPKYRKTQEGHKIEVTSPSTYQFPILDNWSARARKRREMKRQARRLTIPSSLRRSALPFDEDRTVEEIKKDRIKRADLVEGVRNIEREQKDRLTRGWRRFLIEQIDEGAEITEEELDYLKDASTLIAASFLKDDTLSQKARTNLTNIITGKNRHYSLRVDKLAHDPLFSWVYALRNPYIAESLRKSIEESPENAESFYLLLKLMTYRIAEVSFNKRENDFLFDPNYRQKIDKESLIKLYDEIRKRAEKFIPDVSEVAKVALAKGDSEIEDILQPENMANIRAKLEELTYKRVLGFIKFPKSRQFTIEDKQVAKTITTALGVTLGALAIFSLYKASEVYVKITNQELDEQAIAENTLREAEKQQEEKRFWARLEKYRTLQERAKQNVTNEMGGKRQGVTPEEALEKTVGLSQTPEDIGDRIPDAIDREALENIGLATFGKIYHLPETMSGQNGEYVGYFPWDINLQYWSGSTDNDLDTFYYGSDRRKLDNYEIVDSIEHVNFEYKDNQLAYSLNGVNETVYPPIGWRVVKVYQEGGKQPLVGPLGEIYYDYDGNEEDIPGKALFVLEPIKLDYLAPRISRLEDVKLHNYWLSFDRGQAERINGQLAGDAALQAIHAEMINDISVVKERYYKREISDEELDSELSEVGIKYSGLYAEYTDKNRYYALDFDINENLGDYASIKSIAQNTEGGYFCSVASFAFRDFMNSVGFIVGNQPGMPMVNHSGYLWGKIGHQNSVLLLPNGEILEIDTTPPVTSKTPLEDLKALAGRAVSPDEIEKYIEDLVNEQSKLEGEITDTSPESIDPSAYVNEQELLRLVRKTEGYVSDSEQTEVLKEAREVIREMTAQRLSNDLFVGQERGPNSGQLAEGEIRILQRMRSDIERLLERKINMDDLYLEKVTAEQIEGNISYLEQVKENSDRLQELVGTESGDYGALAQIAQDAEWIKETLEREGEEILKEAEWERMMLSIIESDLRKYYPNLAEQKAQEEAERKRFEALAENYREMNREVAYRDINLIDGLIWFSEEKLDEMRANNQDDNLHIGEDFRQEIATQEQVEEEPELDEKLQSYNGVNERNIVPRLSKLERLIGNTGWLTSRLSGEELKRVDNLPEYAEQLRSVLQEDNTLTEGEERRILTSVMGELTSVSDSFYEARQELINQGRSEQREIERLVALGEVYRKGLENRQNEVVQKISEDSKAEEFLVENAAKLGIGAASLAVAYTGLRLVQKERERKKILERISKSFSMNGNLTRLEKELVVSAAGHLAILSYDDKFPEKAATILNLLQRYAEDEHANSIDWLTNEGFKITQEKSPQDAFARLVFSANGGSPSGQVLEEIRRSFPYDVSEEVARLVKSPNGNGKTPEIKEVPYDFTLAYNLAKLVSSNRITSLIRDVLNRLEIKNELGEVSIPYKVEDLFEVLRGKYASEDTPDRAKSLFNAIYHTLGGLETEASA